jgi:hypothetical protein
MENINSEYYNWTDLFDLDRMSIPCNWTENISLNFKYIFVWIFIFFYLYNAHDIYYISIMIVENDFKNSEIIHKVHQYSVYQTTQ